MPERLPIALAAAVAGWCVGWLSAWLTEYLQREDKLPSSAHGLLVRDVFVQAGSAVVWGLAALLLEWPRWGAVAVLSVPLIQVTVTDIRHRYVYTIIAAAGIVLGLGLGWLAHQGELLDSVKGAVGGAVAFGGLYLLGRLIYRSQEPMARGDITIAAMVGAQAGACTVSALFVGVILSGLLAAGVWLTRHSRHAFMPYGPGLCIGALLSLFLC